MIGGSASMASLNDELVEALAVDLGVVHREDVSSAPRTTRSVAVMKSALGDGDVLVEQEVPERLVRRAHGAVRLVHDPEVELRTCAARAAVAEGAPRSGRWRRRPFVLPVWRRGTCAISLGSVVASTPSS